MGDPYDPETMAVLKEEWKKIDAKSEECKGKMSHKADGVDGLKPFDQCMPKVVKEYKTKKKIYCASWAAPQDDKAPICVATQQGFVLTLDAKTMQYVKPPAKEGFVLECAITDDLRYIVTGGMQNAIKVYDTSKVANGCTTCTGQLSDPDPALDFAAHDGYIAALEFVPKSNGAKLLSASGDGTIKLWDFSEKAWSHTYKGHTADVTGVCTCEDDPNMFASSSTDKSVRVWDMRCPYAVRKFVAKYSTNCCAFLPQAKGVAAGCDNASWETFDVGCNLQIGRGKVNKGRAESIAVSASGRTTYLGWDNDDAGFLLVADTYNPGSMKKIEGKERHTDMVKCLALSPDGNGLASCSFDGNMKIWAAP